MSTGVSHPEETLPHKELGPLPRPLRPFVDWVARIKATVHTKLLAGFLLIALLLLSMGVVSISVLNRVNDQVETLTRLNHQASQARDMIYEVTAAEPHYRAMALLKLDDPTWTPKIYAAKDEFAKNMAEMRTYAVPSELTLLDHVESTNEVYADSSDAVTGPVRGRQDRSGVATPHRGGTRGLPCARGAAQRVDHRLAGPRDPGDGRLRREPRFLTIAVGAFSGVSLLIALTLGAILSWSLIRPVRRVDAALEQIAGGDFNTHVEVPNRDEFGNLTRNLNRTTDQLSALYQRLHDLNANLQETVETKVAELERTSRLRRYLSPQLADSIVSGEQDVALEPSRKYLTTFFSDVRGSRRGRDAWTRASWCTR